MSEYFKYQGPVSGRFFIGREDEVERLSADFMFLTNSVVTAPCGWGKSSIIAKAAETACFKDSKLRVCHVSLSNVRDEELLYIRIAEGVIRAVSSSLDEAVSDVNRYLHGMNPVMNMSDGTVHGLKLDIPWPEVRSGRDVFLQMPERIAADKGLKVVVCIDDFHYVGRFSDPEPVADVFRNGLEGHRNSAFCLSCCQTAFVDEFIRKVPAFYRYGDRICLGEISEKSFISYIRDSFADTGKYIDDEVAGMVVRKVCGHPFYVQQLAHLSWLRTSVVCSKEIVDEAFSSMADQMGQVFGNITDDLTDQQICYLHAVLSGEKVISTSEVLYRYRISSATSASRSKAALLRRGILFQSEAGLSFSDPLYAYWMKCRYFD